VEPRSYTVTADQLRRLPDASVVVVNGLGVDPDLGAALVAVRARGHEVIEAASRLNPLPLPTFGFELPTDNGPVGSPPGTTAPNGAAPLDPHVWLDADRMTQLAHIVGDTVAPLPGVDRSEVSRRIDSYAVELAKADEVVQSALLPLPDGQRALATDRNQLGYFAERYGLNVVAALHADTAPLTNTQRDVVATQMKAAGVHVILTNADPPPAVVTDIAAQTGSPKIVKVDVATLGVPGSATDTEVKLLTVLGQQLGHALAS